MKELQKFLGTKNRLTCWALLHLMVFNAICFIGLVINLIKYGF